MDATELSGQTCQMVPLEVLPAPVAPSAPLCPLQRRNTFLFNMAAEAQRL